MSSSPTLYKANYRFASGVLYFSRVLYFDVQGTLGENSAEVVTGGMKVTIWSMNKLLRVNIGYYEYLSLGKSNYLLDSQGYNKW